MSESTMTPLLKWQYEQLVKELLLLQDHLADPSCPCETEKEMCVRKHLLIVEAYAEETIAMEKDPEYGKSLQQLAAEAKEKRVAQEHELLGLGAGVTKEPLDHMEWVRLWRKHFEPRSIGETSTKKEASDSDS